jgi:polyhydroxybutyrate depolymerase
MLVAVAASCGGGDDADGAAGAGATDDSTGVDQAQVAAADGDAEAAPDPGERPPVPSEGCGRAAAADAGAGYVEGAITVEGVTRPYGTTVPTGQDGETPVPLVLALHGLGQPFETMTYLSGIDEKAEDEGFVAVYPAGRPAGELPRWDVTPPASEGSVAYLRALMDTVGTGLCLDLARVYVTGMSYGGMMTSRVICDMSDVIAAGAPVARTIAFDPCPSERPVPVMAFHGTADRVLPYEGGIGPELTGIGIQQGPATGTPLEASIPEAVAAIAERNGCDPEPAEEQVSEHVTVQEHGGCTDGAEVVFYTVEGGGHSWPGSPAASELSDRLGETTQEISATDLMWDFFMEHPLPEQ